MLRMIRWLILVFLHMGLTQHFDMRANDPLFAALEPPTLWERALLAAAMFPLGLIARSLPINPATKNLLVLLNSLVWATLAEFLLRRFARRQKDPPVDDVDV